MIIPWEELLRGKKMIGIYMVKNKINNKSYIGQSVEIETRWRKHKSLFDFGSVNLLRLALIKYGIENFEFLILEECLIEELDQKEEYYIKKFNTQDEGYNILPGGKTNHGENNPNAKLKIEDVIFIRKIYNSKTDLTKKEIYNEFFKDKVGWRGFEKVWSGDTWKTIKMEVYNEENKSYYKHQAKAVFGSKNQNSSFTDEEVITIRNRYVNETGREIYKDYENKITYSGFERVLLGTTYSNLPIYKKREKTWINN